jgi:hypothetical protein
VRDDCRVPPGSETGGRREATRAGWAAEWAARERLKTWATALSKESWAAGWENSAGLRRLDRAEAKRKSWGRKKKLCKFSKEFKQMNSNTGLNSTNQKLCSSMNATINSYGSLI